MDIKKMINDVSFSITKKESFTLNEVYAIEDQLKNAIISGISKEIEENNISKIELETKVKKLSEDKEVLDKELKEVKVEYESVKPIIEEVKIKKETNEAVKLLKGLVVEGAELDVYGQIKKELVFEEGLKEEDKKIKIKTIVDKVVKQKPYLTFVGKTNSENEGDEENVVTIEKSITVEKDTNEEVEGYDGSGAVMPY